MYFFKFVPALLFAHQTLAFPTSNNAPCVPRLPVPHDFTVQLKSGQSHCSNPPTSPPLARKVSTPVFKRARPFASQGKPRFSQVPRSLKFPIWDPVRKPYSSHIVSATSSTSSGLSSNNSTFIPSLSNTTSSDITSQDNTSLDTPPPDTSSSDTPSLYTSSSDNASPNPSAAPITSLTQSTSPSLNSTPGTTNSTDSGAATFGPSYQVTVTGYGGNCATQFGACGFLGNPTSYQAAVSAYWNSAGLPGQCGTCWRLSNGTRLDSKQRPAGSLGTAPIVVMIDNTCAPDPSKGPDGLCNQDAGRPVNKYGAVADIDLCSDTDAGDAFFGQYGATGPGEDGQKAGFGLGTLTQVDCGTQWKGSIGQTASWDGYSATPGAKDAVAKKPTAG